MWAYNLLSLANPHAALGVTAHFQQLHGRLSASHSECLHRLIYHYPLAECNLNCNQFWLISNQSQCWVERRVGIAGGSRRVGYWFAVNGRVVAGHKTRANWQRATGNRANGRQANLMHWQLGSSAWRAETTATTAAARRPHNQFERSSPSPLISAVPPLLPVLREMHFAGLSSLSFICYLFALARRDLTNAIFAGVNSFKYPTKCCENKLST